jgi:L-fuconolactonase
VAQTVLVQAAPTLAETRFLLQLAEQHEDIAAVVGWVDLAAPRAASQLADLAMHPKFKGIRPMLQDLPEVDWLLHAPTADALLTLKQHGLRLDALVRPAQLPALIAFARKHPTLPIVLDHAGKPPLRQGPHAIKSWEHRLRELAELPQVYCKVSGLLTELSAGQGPQALDPIWQVLLEAFGPQRLMWGSDWPVLNLAGDYATWTAQCEAWFLSLAPDEQAAIWRKNAQRFYALEQV